MNKKLNQYIAEMNGLSALKFNDKCQKLAKEFKQQGKKLKTEKILNISLILNATLSLSVILLSITIFAIMVYGTIGIYD